MNTALSISRACWEEGTKRPMLNRALLVLESEKDTGGNLIKYSALVAEQEDGHLLVWNDYLVNDGMEHFLVLEINLMNENGKQAAFVFADELHALANMINSIVKDSIKGTA